ncbi:peptidoglycan recognition protein family protein [Cellulomonas triticagri]|uniref:peptidoglycan recognition protein family protein n=1 Tax=Cellulomonas triticagri TaxID=2483352 RepID=UPI001315672E|nr:N-acetylmuramoyl-L-alanine amidase [Cellulomonas triticagri]
MPSRLALSLLVAVATALPAGLVAPTATAADQLAGRSTAAAPPVGVTEESLEASLGAEATEAPDDPAVETTVDETDVVVAPLAEAASPAARAQERTTQGDAVLPGSSQELDPVDAADGPVVADVVDDGEPARVVTPPVQTGGAQTVGVTWPAGAQAADLEPQVRSLTEDGWTGWVDLEASDLAADAGTTDAEHELRGGTDSLWIGDAEAVQVSFAATADGGPQGMSLAMVTSPEEEPAVQGASSSGGLVIRDAAFVPAAVAAPRVYSRAEWGARAQSCAPDVARTLLAAVVHHTAGSNSYSTVAQAMQQIRNDQAYHITGRGWCDIGYNFLVDKWGNVYEGRANSGTQPVIGVHAGGFNTATVGVSMLGDYSGVTPSAGTQESVARVIAWRLSQYHRDPTSTVGYTTLGGENSRYPGGTTLALPVVVGHRDTAYTACPGNAGYAVLGAIKNRARAIIGAGFVNPAATTTSMGIGGSVSVTGGVITGANWSLAVTDTRTGIIVQRVNGSSGPSGGGAIATWNGRVPAGTAAGPGTYRLTLTGTYGATTLVPYTSTVTISGSQNPPTVAPVALTGDLGFVPMAPVRLLDTRPSAASLGPDSRLDLKVAGVSGIPADAKAVALTVTAVNSSTITHVRAWPAGQARPDASVLNTDPGRTTAGSLVVGVGGEGKVSLYNNLGSTHLLVDVTGYYTSAATSGFEPLPTAVRALDTRQAGGTVAPGTRRTVQVAGAGGVPADATAVAVNVVSVKPSSVGYVSVIPSGATAGTTSTVNNQPGRDTANRAVVTLAGGKLDVYVGGVAQHVVVDVVGWYGSGADATFTPVAPVRAFDTRSGSPLGAGEQRSLTVSGLPAGTTAVAMNLTSTRATSAATYLTVWGSGARPATSDLNAGAGRDQANQVYVAPASGRVNVYNNLGSSHVVADVFGYFSD